MWNIASLFHREPNIRVMLIQNKSALDIDTLFCYSVHDILNIPHDRRYKIIVCIIADFARSCPMTSFTTFSVLQILSES
jgi:hypothetical protein